MASKKKITKKKITKKKSDIGMAELVQAQMELDAKEAAEFEKQYPAFKCKVKINENDAVKTVHKMAEFYGIGELNSLQVKQFATLLMQGTIEFKNDALFYNLRKGVEVGDGKYQKQFEIIEVPDGVFEDADVDAFTIGLLNARGRIDEVSDTDIRKIARLAIRLNEDYFRKLPTKDVMGIYAVYIPFFLGR